MGVFVKGWSDFLEIGANSTVGRVEFWGELRGEIGVKNSKMVGTGMR